jgi:phosphoribosyl 1,2-cyclic phosphodiesterase
MLFSVLASGSSGNASLIEMGGFGVLIDAGLGPRQLAKRLADAGASWHHVHAVLLTHIHGDHWNERTLRHLHRHGIPVFCHGEHQDWLGQESQAFHDLWRAGLVRNYQEQEELRLSGTLRCVPVPIRHDGGVTCGFRFEGEADFFGRRWSLGYATDLGSWEEKLVDALANVDVLALEFNHDVDLEMNSGRSPELIARVLGDAGHLSNLQAAELVRRIVGCSEPGRLRHLVQLHLSRECNRPALARAAAREALADDVKIHSARQDRSGPCLALGRSKRRVENRRRVNRHQACFRGWE